MRTFLDSGVLLAAWKHETLCHIARELMADDDRVFLSSQMVRLETLPKPLYEKQNAEVEFFENHFQNVEATELLSPELGNAAEALARRYGLAGSDAIQIAAAIRQGAGEFYTSEKPGRPLFRVKEIKIISLYSLA